MLILDSIKNRSRRIRAYSIMTISIALIDLFVLILTIYILNHILPEQPSAGYITLFASCVIVSFFASIFNHIIKNLFRLQRPLSAKYAWSLSNSFENVNSNHLKK
jgi:ABC-type multidrug transport system fused ATPase/permease subunit